MIKINTKLIGKNSPCYIIAEMSANHNHDIEKAEQIIKAAADCKADAVKLQTYTADTLTIDCNNKYFQINGTLWNGNTLYNLYQEAYTPWEWHERLQAVALDYKLDFFSTPFDASSVEFLEKLNVPCYKVASFENVDMPLLKKIASTGKPVIMSTGMANLAEIYEAVETLQKHGTTDLILLKCTSAYPSLPEEANLLTIPHMAQAFKCEVGLSDHTMGSAVAVAAVTLGASVIEKHFTLSRQDIGPDSSFSLEPEEFARMVQDIRIAEKSLGQVCYEITPKQKESLCFRRSLFVVKNMKKGEVFSLENLRSIRPAYGLHTRYQEDIIGREARCDIERGTPFSWNLL